MANRYKTQVSNLEIRAVRHGTARVKLENVGMMLHLGPSFVLYALLLDPGCCPRAHIEVDGQFESDQKKRAYHIVRACLCGVP